MRASTLILLAIASFAAQPASAADHTAEEARTYFEAGRQAYEAGRYGTAVTAFEEAYRLSPKPQVLFSLAQAQRQKYMVDRDIARLRRAVELFRTYVDEVAKGGRRDHAMQHLADLEPQLRRAEEERAARAKNRAERAPPKLEVKTQLMVTSRTENALAALDGEEPSELPLIRDVPPGRHKVLLTAEGFDTEEIEGVAVEGRLVVVNLDLKEKQASIRVRAPDGAEVTIDGRAAGRAPIAGPSELPAGRHFVVVAERGSYAYSREVVLDRGQELSLDVSLEPTTQRTISYCFMGVASALIVAGSVTGGLALAAEGRAKGIDERRTARLGLSAEDLSDYRSSVDTRDRFAPIAATLLGTGIAVTATGVLLYFIDSPRVESERAGRQTALIPSVTTGGANVAVSASF